ncbi:hypothetical protein [Halalkalibacter oceani]|uniref:hypothetical protein n=1 Tax=Halalkalibacter oceani TaxID=1653776 RepID=UPI0033977687
MYSHFLLPALNFIIIAINSIWDLILSVSYESIQFLSWTTAVIAALLALTTIIFSQYNDKLVHKANDISKNLKEDSFNTLMIKEVSPMYNKMVETLSNQTVYKRTQMLFQAVSFSLAILWLISGIGYAHTNVKLTYSDSFIVYSATFLIVITFILLPIIMKSFNNNQPLKVKNNTVTIDEFFSYFENETLSKPILLEHLVNPVVTFTLFQNKISIKFSQRVIVSNIYYIFEFVSENNIIFLKINNKSGSARIFIYDLKSKNKKVNNFTGLFSLLKSNQISKKIYIFNYKKNELLACYETTMNINSHDEITYTIKKFFHNSTSSELQSFAKSNSLFKHNNNDYKLIDNK